MSDPEKKSEKEFFQVPEGYFDQLPGRIQRRIATVHPARYEQRPVLRYALALALTVVAVTAIVLSIRTPTPDPVSMLTTVETADLVQYLEESDMTTDEVFETIDFTPRDIEALEDE